MVQSWARQADLKRKIPSPLTNSCYAYTLIFVVYPEVTVANFAKQCYEHIFHTGTIIINSKYEWGEKEGHPAHNPAINRPTSVFFFLNLNSAWSTILKRSEFNPKLTLPVSYCWFAVTKQTQPDTP